MSPRGRRPGGEDTRAAIIAAARAEFAQRGYDGTSLRGIAREAGVDAKLVHHYFDGKAELFAEVLAFPADPSELIDRLVTVPRAELGEGLVRVFLSVWDNPVGRQRFAAMFAAAAANEEHARMVREFVGREIFVRLIERISEGVEAGEASAVELRAALGAAQLIGMGVLRYVVKIPALADATVEEIVAILGPTLQEHLVPSHP
ncbi:putative transcriptional regulator [Janibacter sp. HTCC2649]|uniref:TetR/AcrR family transcriptional regulator n=1 Tax=Janibacter sp. HTCC2649 TaxID=313589 RepID=UPI0000670C05|nr:TetR family transcriptional regulator [Janibacter sp. HTCC2649]EAQ00371.1 putative transcriptional regulator [Janibacter sp. HTCC2649]